MELILATGELKDIKRLDNIEIDIDLGGDNDFELKVNRGEIPGELTYGSVVYVPGTEYGGIVGEIDTNTSLDTTSYYGYTWRGMLENKIIKPPAGEDYKIVSGELNSVLNSLISENFSTVFSVSEESTGVNVEGYQFNRYVTLLAGIKKMLKSVGYKLHIEYTQQTGGVSGYVLLSAVPIVDYSQTIELSQDDQLDFTFKDVRNGVNHLVCLGKGELKDRTVIDLYIQKDGSIGTSQYYTGIDEIAEVYEDVNLEEDDLKEKGIDKLKELASYTLFEMDVGTLNIDVEIGDIIGGRDYLTGLYTKKPVEEKIWRISDGAESVEYKIEGDEEEDEAIE